MYMVGMSLLLLEVSLCSELNTALLNISLVSSDVKESLKLLKIVFSSSSKVSKFIVHSIVTSDETMIKYLIFMVSCLNC